MLEAAVAIAKMLKFNESSNPNFDESDLKENANVHLAKKIWKVRRCAGDKTMVMGVAVVM